MTNSDYSVQDISEALLEEIKTALYSVKQYGSVEIFIQKGCVTQITARKISKLAPDVVSKLAFDKVSKLANAKTNKFTSKAVKETSENKAISP